MFRLRASLFRTLRPGVLALLAQVEGKPEVVSPQVISKVDPDYTEAARLAKLQGTVVLRLVVDENGQPQNITVVSPLGPALDQQGIGNGEAVAIQTGKTR